MSENIIKGREYNEISDILNTIKIDKKAAKEIVEIFIKNNLLLTTHAYEYILKNEIYEKGCVEDILKIAKDNGTNIVTEEFIIEFCIKKETKTETEKDVKKKTGEKIEEKRVEPEKTANIEEKQEEEKTSEKSKNEEKKEIEEQAVKIKAKEEAVKEQKEAVKEQKEAVKEQKEAVKEQVKDNKRSAIKSNFKISDYSITSDGKISDFAAYFQDKYKILSSIIKRRIEYRDAKEISKINEGDVACIVGMISDKFENKQYGLTLTIEDLTGSMRIIPDKSKISPDTEKLIIGLVSDEVIGVKGKMGKNNKTMYVSDIVEPDVPYDVIPNKAEKEIYAVFTSDFHIGSILFLQKEFENFIEWINLKRNRLDLAEKVKYILIAGDIVDGVGVYPHQERELALTDIYKQYDFAAELISRIPEDIEIIISPGNHDAVRIAEPQPELSKKFAPKFYEMKNVHLVKNPAYVNIEGVNVLMYHGEALDNLIRAIPGLSYSAPEKGMKEFLKKRHLSPVYADIFPSEKDNLAIKDIPDVIHCGHVHSIGYENYRGVHLINSGCFQGRTKFQEEMGHIPTPSKVPIMNLKTHDITIMDFG
ncbi:putative DNA polymerase II small subunit [groundwater metagenome]|uniref:DNA polymerase II small subunit n=1 Tax=groundwater metagenome TaxID=717931 RepID=A0A098E9E5_9ZZZZ